MDNSFHIWEHSVLNYMTAYRGMVVEIHSLLILAQGRSEQSASCSGCFTARERDLGSYRTGGWKGPRASTDTLEKMEISYHYQNSFCFPAHSLVTLPTELVSAEAH
jgi:hypothetical protein